MAESGAEGASGAQGAQQPSAAVCPNNSTTEAPAVAAETGAAKPNPTPPPESQSQPPPPPRTENSHDDGPADTSDDGTKKAAAARAAEAPTPPPPAPRRRQRHHRSAAWQKLVNCGVSASGARLVVSPNGHDTTYAIVGHVKRPKAHRSPGFDLKAGAGCALQDGGADLIIVSAAFWAVDSGEATTLDDVATRPVEAALIDGSGVLCKALCQDLREPAAKPTQQQLLRFQEGVTKLKFLCNNSSDATWWDRVPPPPTAPTTADAAADAAANADADADADGAAADGAAADGTTARRSSAPSSSAAARSSRRSRRSRRAKSAGDAASKKPKPTGHKRAAASARRRKPKARGAAAYVIALSVVVGVCGGFAMDPFLVTSDACRKKPSIKAVKVRRKKPSIKAVKVRAQYVHALLPCAVHRP